MTHVTDFLTTCLQAAWAERTGWTLVHSLWQIAAITGVYALLVLVLRNRSASARYMVGCVAMAAMLALPAVTYVMLPTSAVPEVETLSDPTPVAATPLPKPSMTPRDFTFTEPEAIAVDPPAAAPVPTQDEDVAFIASVSSSLQHCIPWITAAWLVGVLLLSFRPLWGWLHVRRLRRHGLVSLSDPLQEICGNLATRLGVRRAVEFAQSALVEVPTVVGYLKPMVLLPASALSGLSTSQIELILAHELAHVRRHDYLVNLVQTVVESLLFYHPGMWWVSSQIRRERENCCDDMALALGGSRANYVRALAQLEERRSVPTAALAASGGSLLPRARRLLGQPQRGFGYRHATAWLAGVVTIGLVAAALMVSGVAQGETKHSAAKEVDTAESNDTESDAHTPDEDGVVWDKPQDGWQVGAKLLSTTDKLQPGEPVVMQLLLKNVTDESRTVVLQDYHDTHPTLGADGRISMNISGDSTGRRQHVIAPGAILERSEYRVVLSTQGMLPGEYRIDPQPAFWEPDVEDSNRATGIGRNTPVRFTLGDPASVKYTQPPVEKDPAERIYWGERVSGLVVGMRLPSGRAQWPGDARIEGEVFVRNVSDRTIRLEYEVPPAGEWNTHVTTSDGEDVRLDWVWYSGMRPRVTRELTLKPGEQARVEGNGGPALQVLKEKTPFKRGDPPRLITDGGQYTWAAYLVVAEKSIPDLTMVIGSGAVPFEIDGGDDGPSDDTPATEQPDAPSGESETKPAEDQSDLDAMQAYAKALAAGDFEALEKTWEFQDDLDRQFAEKLAEMFAKAKDMRVDLVSMRRLGEDTLFACFLMRGGPERFAGGPAPLFTTFQRKDGRWRCSPPGDLRSMLGARTMAVDRIGRRALSQHVIALRLGPMDAESQIARIKAQAEAFARLAGPPYNLSQFETAAKQLQDRAGEQEAALRAVKTRDDLWHLIVRESEKDMMPEADDFVLSFYLEARKDDPKTRELSFPDSKETFRAELFPCLTEDAVLEAKVVADPARNMPSVEVTLTEGGKKRLAQLTQDAIGRRLGIVVDGKVVSAPIIRAPIVGGKARVDGHFTLEEAEAIVGRLNAYREEAREFLEGFGDEERGPKGSKAEAR